MYSVTNKYNTSVFGFDAYEILVYNICFGRIDEI